MRSVITEVNCFIEGYGNLGRAVSFKAPELKQKSINGTTGVGDRSYATGQFESLDSEFSCAALPEAVFNALSKLDEAELIFKKAIRTGSKVDSYTWVLKGEMLDIKVSQKGVKKYIHEINNKVKVKIDHDNLICEIDGKDLMGDVRRVLRA